MGQLFLVALGGFLAGLVDGSLGMGFGPTSSTVLLGAGVSPITTSATVNLAKVVTGIVSGGAHWRMGNVDRTIVIRLAGSGVVGALIGTSVLVAVDGETIRPFLSAVLVVVGIRLLLRFARWSEPAAVGDADAGRHEDAPVSVSARAVRITALGGGITNGLIGAWGPVVTPFLLHRRVPPRVVVGSVNTAEVAIALVSVGSLAGQFGQGGIDPMIVLAMLTGGVVAAPLAAHTVRFIPPRILGLAMAALLLATQLPPLLTRIPWPGRLSELAIIVGIIAATVVGIAVAGRVVSGGARRRDRRPGRGRRPGDRRSRAPRASRTP